MKVELIDHMGSDLSVVNAARVSFDKQSEWANQAEVDESYYGPDSAVQPKLSDKDTKLIRYLAKHNHWTPFGHCFASFRVKAPIFVARQLGKHQVGLVWNEVSRRYVDSEPEFYTPDFWRKKADNVKQGSSNEPTEVKHFVWEGPNEAGEQVQIWESFSESAERYTKAAVSLYGNLLMSDVCPEQARMVLPQSMYTEWVWSGSLAAFARVCKLRLDPHTQKETRDVAEMIDALMRPLFPVSWEALMETE